MKKLITLFTCSFMFFTLYSQVEMKKTKNTLMGKNSLIATDKEKYTLDNFSITLILYGFAEDQGGSSNVAQSAKVGVRADLTEVDSSMAQEIVDEAYAYFEEQWKKRGISVHKPSVDEIEASKKYSKAKSKGKKHAIINGGTYDNHTKKKHELMAWPKGVNIGTCGSGPMAANGNYQTIGLDKTFSGHYTSYNATVNFIEFKTAKLGSTASVKTFPQLKVSNNMTAQTWKKGKVGNYIGRNIAEGTKEFYTDLKKKEIEVLNSSANMWNYVADKAKYKANVLEMIKKGMDDMFADYDVVVSENKK